MRRDKNRNYRKSIRFFMRKVNEGREEGNEGKWGRSSGCKEDKR